MKIPTTPPFPARAPQHLVRKVALHPAQSPATGMGGDDRSGTGTDRVPESLIRGMGDIHQHPDPVALPNHLSAEIIQPGLRVQLPAGVNPAESRNMGQRKDPDPHAVIHPQDGQIVVDPARVEHGDHRNLAGSDYSLHVSRPKGQLHGIRVPPHGLQHLVDALQDPLDHLRAVKQVLDNVLATWGGSMIPSRASLTNSSSTPIPWTMTSTCPLRKSSRYRLP